MCDTLELLPAKLLASIRGVNRLRNAFAHSPIQKVESRELIKFLWTDYDLHPFQRQEPGGNVGFSSFEEMRTDFEKRENIDLEDLVLVSLDLIRASLSSMFTDEAPKWEN